MDISSTIAEMKKEPGFSENVGMVLIHNGVVRGWSRSDRSSVSRVEVAVDHQRIEELRKSFEQRPGIYKIVVEPREGVMEPGDDLLFILVAGDIRENVKPALADLLDVIKKEAISKKET